MFSITYFTPVLWPEFSIWNLLAGVFFYQRQKQMLAKLRLGEVKEGVVEKCRIEQNTTVASLLSVWWAGGLKTD